MQKEQLNIKKELIASNLMLLVYCVKSSVILKTQV